jgi:hypothetical protein
MEELEVYFLHQTERAILVNITGNLQGGVWLPKSMIQWDDTSPARGSLVTITAPEWLLLREELI